MNTMINLIVQKAFLFSVILLLVSTLANAQIKQSTAEEIQQSINQRAELAKNSFLKNYPVRSIGPVVQGARITDIAVSAKNPKDYYVAYASGGLFRTDNNGITFRPIFDNQGSLTIGDIALFEGDKTIIWIGTGENNSSRSSYSGSGIYKSEDDGKTWKQMGLVHTFHIGKIILHPSNPDIVWVASIGALYSPNEERGVYKTTDGGKTWLKTLFIDKYTGVIDLVINSENPDQLFAASWQRLRKTWHFDGDGTGSSIYVSNDGGLNWTKTVTGV